jgi:hypothetical protein
MSKATCAIVAGVTVVLVLACAVACLAVVGVVAYFRADIGVGDRAQVQDAIVSEVAVESPATLTMRNPAGTVTIRTGPQNDRIIVEATKEADSVFGRQAERLADQVDLQIEGEGSEARVEVDLPDASGVGFARVNLVITVPEETHLNVVNEAGHVQIRGTEGDIRVRSEAGNLRIEDVTVSQSCDVMNTAGSITFEGQLPEPGAGDEPWEVVLRTEVGNIDFAVPVDSRFTLDAESEAGSVNAKFELDDPQSGSVRREAGEWLKGGVNGSQASPNVILRTETGNIRVTPLR